VLPEFELLPKTWMGPKASPPEGLPEPDPAPAERAPTGGAPLDPLAGVPPEPPELAVGGGVEAVAVLAIGVVKVKSAEKPKYPRHFST
jgi:hypothetical protein